MDAEQLECAGRLVFSSAVRLRRHVPTQLDQALSEFRRRSLRLHPAGQRGCVPESGLALTTPLPLRAKNFAGLRQWAL